MPESKTRIQIQKAGIAANNGANNVYTNASKLERATDQRNICIKNQN